jgi:hypothetical protein
MTKRVVCLFLLALAAGFLRAETARPSGVVERVEVRGFYLCDGYQSFGDATFYDCARRFFREAAHPASPAELAGQWSCRSAFNGPSTNWEQPLFVAHYEREKSRRREAIDRLLVLPSAEPMAPKKVAAWVGQPSPSEAVANESVAGEIVRGPKDWTSTAWGYGEKPVGFDVWGGSHEAYSQRTSFRLRDGRLLLEHVVRDAERKRLIELGRRQAVSRGELGDLLNRVAQKTLLQGETYSRPNWTEEALRATTPIAEYGEDWTLPILYSECRRSW